MNNLIKNRVYRAALYVRLSKEDGDKEESDSIVNQKDLIRNYLEDKPDIIICAEYVDDGYSGTNFDRPDFKRMIQQIEAGNINCIVVKDLSRFGRNFIETGRYIEQIFPSHNIRFIAINDQYDSIAGRTSSDMILIPFKNLINDAYCRDISVKIRSQLEIKRKKGDFIGSFAVYGYRKSPEDHHRLEIDDYAADVVRNIFKWKIDGASQQKIADRLNEQGELSPMEYKRFCGLQYKSGFQVNPKSKWTAVAIGRILHNEIYIGTLVQGKRTTPNHKVKKILVKPPEEWIRVEHNHPPIINREDFITVERLLLQDTRIAPSEEKVYLFSGLLFCGDCGHNMVRSSTCRNGKSYIYYMCGNHRTNKVCTSHRISNAMLEQSVLFSLQQHIAHIVDMEHILACIEALPCYRTEAERLDRRLIKKQEEEIKYKRLKTALYESLTDGLIDKAEYVELKEAYNTKLKDIRTAMAKLREEEDSILKNCPERTLWIKKFKQYQGMTKLTRYIVVMLVERIKIYENCRIEIRFQYQDSYERALSLMETTGDPLRTSDDVNSYEKLAVQTCITEEG